MCLEPIKISRIPDGALQQAAMKQSQFSKDRKDIRDLKTRRAANENTQDRGSKSTTIPENVNIKNAV